MVASVKDLLERKKNLESLDEKSEKQQGFSGSLQDLSVVELVQLLNLNKKSGVLKIENGEKAFVYINQGNLWAVRKGDKKGEEAFYDIVAQKKGTFKFDVTEVSVEQNIVNSTMNVIMEACRVTDEQNMK